jgi:hypothetical protein
VTNVCLYHMLAAIANQAAKNPGLEQSELLPSVILLAAAITSGGQHEIARLPLSRSAAQNVVARLAS